MTSSRTMKSPFFTLEPWAWVWSRCLIRHNPTIDKEIPHKMGSTNPRSISKRVKMMSCSRLHSFGSFRRSTSSNGKSHITSSKVQNHIYTHTHISTFRYKMYRFLVAIRAFWRRNIQLIGVESMQSLQHTWSNRCTVVQKLVPSSELCITASILSNDCIKLTNMVFHGNLFL